MHPLHERALKLCMQHRRLEFEIIEILEEIERSKIFKTMGYSSLSTYSVRELRLSEATAYQFIAVMRSARKHEGLRLAL